METRTRLRCESLLLLPVGCLLCMIILGGCGRSFQCSFDKVLAGPAVISDNGREVEFSEAGLNISWAKNRLWVLAGGKTAGGTLEIMVTNIGERPFILEKDSIMLAASSDGNIRREPTAKSEDLKESKKLAPGEKIKIGFSGWVTPGWTYTPCYLLVRYQSQGHSAEKVIDLKWNGKIN